MRGTKLYLGNLCVLCGRKVKEVKRVHWRYRCDYEGAVYDTQGRLLGSPVVDGKECLKPITDAPAPEAQRGARITLTMTEAQAQRLADAIVRKVGVVVSDDDAILAGHAEWIGEELAKGGGR